MTDTEYQKKLPPGGWIVLCISAPKQKEDLLIARLDDLGIHSIEISDPTIIARHLAAGDWDASRYDGQTLQLDRIEVKAWLCDDAAGAAQLAAVEAALQADSELQLSWQQLPAVDWQQSWKAGFAGRPIGKRLWVAPVWQQDSCPPERVPLWIEPGMAFGTGDHATTQMALSLLEEVLCPGVQVLDLGCGSGILGLAALKLGAAAVVAVDIDPVCEAAVATHQALNQIDAEAFALQIGDVLSDVKLQRSLRAKKADLVLANITADVLCLLAPQVGRYMAEGARLICSGILSTAADRVAKALLDAGFVLLQERTSGEWTAFLAAVAAE